MGCHVCPWWVGYFLLNPLRKFLEDPQKILSEHISEGMTVMDFGSAMGYFSLPAAEIVGTDGKVLCVDIQERMLKSLHRRARKRSLDRVIETVAVENTEGLLPYSSRCDVILAIHVVHEVPDQSALFRALHTALKPGGRVVVIEPPKHVAQEAFNNSLEKAGEYFSVFTGDTSRGRLSAELIKRAPVHNIEKMS